MNITLNKNKNIMCAEIPKNIAHQSKTFQQLYS